MDLLLEQFSFNLYCMWTSRSMFRAVYILLFLSSFSVSFGSECEQRETCNCCITYPNEKCVWCPDPNLPKNVLRCQSATFHETNNNWCSQSVINPGEKTKIYKNDDVNHGISSSTIQITPQELHIDARSGSNVPFEFTYKPAEHYPLDLYFLIDISNSMSNYAKTINKASLEIFESLSKYTNNVQLGFGTFVEKPALPFADPEYTKRIKHVVYSFRHHLNLTKDSSNIKTAFKDLTYNGYNYDDPEASLDALMQAMVCQEDVGWRDNARHFIVLFTDSTYHSAGDGKFVGAHIRNDMTCHLNENKYHDTAMSLRYDYPSVGQINKVAADKKIQIIFSVPSNRSVWGAYTNLEKRIQGAKCAPMTSDSDIADMIKEYYKEELSEVHFRHDKIPDHLRIALEPDCFTKGVCTVAHQESLTVRGKLTVLNCPEQKETKIDTIEILPSRLYDKLTIKVNLTCDCNCEKKEPDSCTSSTNECGVCVCSDNATNSPGCVNADCGVEKQQCLKCDGQECAGHGKCIYGQCNCDVGWTHRGDKKDCSCTTDRKECEAPVSNKMCSGRGKCECGECVCSVNGNETYSGVFCERCKGCPAKRCDDFKEIAQCAFTYNVTYCRQKHKLTEDTRLYVKDTKEINDQKWKMAMWCTAYLDNTHDIPFRFVESYGVLNILVQSESELSPAANIYTAVGISFGTVLLIGMITLIVWKVLTDLHDRREFEKFQKEALAAGFNVEPDTMNPIFVQPTVQYQNPAYNRENSKETSNKEASNE